MNGDVGDPHPGTCTVNVPLLLIRAQRIHVRLCVHLLGCTWAQAIKMIVLLVTARCSPRMPAPAPEKFIRPLRSAAVSTPNSTFSSYVLAGSPATLVLLLRSALTAKSGLVFLDAAFLVRFGTAESTCLPKSLAACDQGGSKDGGQQPVEVSHGFVPPPDRVAPSSFC